MARKTGLTHLTEEILNTVVECTGPLALFELFKIGNPVLTSKLCACRGLMHYSDNSVHGAFDCAHYWLIPQLKGLRSLSLTNLPSSTDSTYNLIRNLPVSLTDLDLQGPGSLEVWFERGKRTKLVKFDFSRFPELKSLSLKYPDESSRYFWRLDSEEFYLASDKRGPWLSHHLPTLPTTLTSLKLDWDLWNIDITKLQFPPLLEHLEIGVTNLAGYSWLFKLPNLHTLSLHIRSDWPFVSDLDDEAQHPALKNVTISCIGKADMVQALVLRLPSLEVLDLGEYGRYPGPSTENQNLERLSCRFTPLDKYPSSVTDLICPLEQSRNYRVSEVYPIQWYMTLPPVLRTFHALNIEVKVRQLPLLPRTITCLAIGQWDLEMDSNVAQSMPPLVTRLQVFVHKNLNGDQQKALHAAFLANLGRLGEAKHLRVFHFHFRTAIRTNNSKLALPGSAWTTAGHSVDQEDYTSLEEIFREVMQTLPVSNVQKHRHLWSSIFDHFRTKAAITGISDAKIDVENASEHQPPLLLPLPESSLNWLRMRGLCVYPRKIGSVDSPWWIRRALEANRGDFVGWALKYLRKEDWSLMAPSILPLLSKDAFIPLLDYLSNNEFNIGPSIYDLKTTDNAALFASIHGDQLAATKWLIEHGHNQGLNIQRASSHWKQIISDGSVKPERVLGFITLLRANLKQVKCLRDADGLITTQIQARLREFLPSTSSHHFIFFKEWLVDLGYKVPKKASRKSRV